MNKIKTLLITAVTASGLVGVGATAIYAAEPTTVRTNHMQSLVTALAQKFNLPTTDVQAVFDQQHQQMQVTMQTKHAEDQKARLDKAVAAGTLTQAQENAIIAKQAEVKAFMESLKGKTPAEREAAMTAQRTALTQWVKENNIPAQFSNLGGFGRPGMGRGHLEERSGKKGGKMMGEMRERGEHMGRGR